MGTVMEDIQKVSNDIKTFVSRVWNIFGRIWSLLNWFFTKLKFWGKKVQQAEKLIQSTLPNQIKKPIKHSIIKHVMYKIFPKAKLTYWLADEEVVVYVSEFHTSKFKMTYRELITGRHVIVNSSTQLNYRLEQLKPGDEIKETEIQQNQQY
jgi:hypothetical protein